MAEADLASRPSICLSVKPPNRLEDPPQSRLQLARIAEAAANRAVKIEEQAAVSRIAEVVVAGEVEHLDDRLDLAARADTERTREPHIPREIRIVLAQRVALEDVAIGAVAIGGRRRALTGGRRERAERARSAALRYRLRRVVADAVVHVDAAGDLDECPGVDAVALIAVAPAVLVLERVGTRVPERERVALV